LKDGDVNVEVGVDVANKGDTLSFTVPQGENESEKTINCNVLASKSIDNTTRRNVDPSSAVWYIKLDINGDRFRSGNVSMYTNATGGTVMDVWMDGQVGDNHTHTQVVIPKIDHSSAAGGVSSGK